LKNLITTSQKSRENINKSQSL